MGGYNPNNSNARKPPQKAGTNRELIKRALASWRLGRVDLHDPVAIEERIHEYLTYCMENDCPPSVAGCANWLGAHVDTLRDWYSGRFGSPEHQRVMGWFYGVMQEIWSYDMHDGNINPVSGIFMGKVFYGYKDTQEIVVKQNNGAETKSNAELIADSKLLPGADRLALPEGTQTIDIEAKVIEPQKEAQKDEPQKKKRGRPRNPEGAETKKQRYDRRQREQKEQNQAEIETIFGNHTQDIHEG